MLLFYLLKNFYLSYLCLNLLKYFYFECFYYFISLIKSLYCSVFQGHRNLLGHLGTDEMPFFKRPDRAILKPEFIFFTYFSQLGYFKCLIILLSTNKSYI